ncbi:ribose ABC transporter substrate-binding protein [Burkholderia cenocepacia]|nr:ribose ABC transporter substrate-binding protein [Burkholderia cenocepacia]
MFSLKRVSRAIAVCCLVASSVGAQAADKTLIGFSQATMNHPWRIAMVNVNKQYAAQNYPDVEVLVTDGQNSANKQVSDVEGLIARHVKVLMISPLQAQALTPVVREAMSDGIKVVTIDREVNTPVTVHIGAENRPIGLAAGKFLAQALHGTGNVIEIQGTAGASPTLDRHNGFADGIKGTQIKVVATQYCDYLREPALKFMEDQLQRFGPGTIQAVYAHNDEMALAAVQALQAAGRLKEVKVIGIDGQNTAFQAVKDGTMAATFIYPFAAPDAIEYAHKVALGEKVPAKVVMPGQQVDATNVDKYLGKGF